MSEPVLDYKCQGDGTGDRNLDVETEPMTAAYASYEFCEALTFSTLTTEVPDTDVVTTPPAKKLVMVNNRYTFHHNLDLKVGDEVVCEAADGHQWIGTVTATESTFTGNTKAVVKKFVGNLAAKVQFKNIDELKMSFRRCQSQADVRMVAGALYKKTKSYGFTLDEVSAMLSEVVEVTKQELAKWTSEEAA